MPPHLAAARVLAHVQSVGATIALADDGMIDLDAPAAVFTTLAGEIRAQKPAIVALLREAPGVPVDWLAAVGRLRTARAPAALSSAAWRALATAAHGLVRDRGAQLARLGWTTADLFAADGLVPHLIDGGEVIALTARTAAIRTSAGLKRFFSREGRRRAADRASPMLWDLPAPSAGTACR